MPPLPAQQAARRDILPAALANRAEIGVMAAKLDVDSVRRALTEDFTALSAKQARILALELAPIAREANGYLAIAVNRGGVDALNTAGAILWTIGDLPRCEERARALLEWHNLDEDVADVERQARMATELVE